MAARATEILAEDPRSNIIREETPRAAKPGAAEKGSYFRLALARAESLWKILVSPFAAARMAPLATFVASPGPAACD